MSQLLRFSGSVEWDPAVARWFDERPTELGALALQWFKRLRESGSDVRELLHDGFPTACVEDAPFGYVGIYKAHINVGFFHGAALADPTGLLEGTGRYMRHMKVRPGLPSNASALTALIGAAYKDIRVRLVTGQSGRSTDL